MSQLLISHLNRKVLLNTDLEVLKAQWDIDRHLILNALKSIPINFPHYSLHDHSHSVTILQQIERFLGVERINQLTAVDTWLILESAYLHDIGMVIPFETLKEEWKKPEFQKFIYEIANNEQNEFCQFAKYLIDPTKNSILNSNVWPLELKKAITIFIAEYFRKIHAENSGKVVLDPVSSIQLHSPRNGLIPDRLFSILSDICVAHGKDFNFVMSLPAIENGLSTEDAHPRFIACLLRLGDLLDIDNHRFCPTMISAFGKLPSDSIAHVEKHAAIKHFFVGPKSIRISAECENVDAYSALQNWLQWLSDEIKNQMGKWPQIMPDGFPGTLPTFDESRINAKGYVSVSESQTTKFSVNEKRAQELFFGENIYKDQTVFIRELLQNAVDATLLTAWLDFIQFSKLAPNIDLSDNQRKNWSEYIQKCMERFKIQVDFDKKNTDLITRKEIWSLSIFDRGIGIDESDLIYMKETLTSSENKRKKDIIDSMPAWARPAGSFGLGLQSVFLVSEEFSFESKSCFNSNAFKFEFCNPSGKNRGRILTQKLDNFPYEHGSKLTFDLEFDSIPPSFSFNEDSVSAAAIVRSFDPISDDSFPIMQAKIKDAIIRFAHGSPFSIYLGNLKLKSSSIDKLEPGDKKKIFDEKTMIEITLLPMINPRPIRISYRGQPVIEADKTIFHLFYVAADLADENANYWLTVDRNSIRPSKVIELRKKIEDAVENTLPEFLEYYTRKAEADSATLEDKNSLGLLHLSLYLYYHELSGKVDSSKFFNLKAGMGNFPNFHDLSNEKHSRICFEIKMQLSINYEPESIRWDSNGRELHIIGISRLDEFMLTFLRKEFNSHRIDSIEYEPNEVRRDKRNLIYIVENSAIPSDSLSPEVFKRYWIEYLKNFELTYLQNTTRLWFSKFSDEFTKLEVDLLPPYMYVLDNDMRTYTSKSRIISPFRRFDNAISLEGIEEVIKYTQANAHVKNQSIEEIAKLYDKLVISIDQLLIDEPLWNKYRKY